MELIGTCNGGKVVYCDNEVRVVGTKVVIYGCADRNDATEKAKKNLAGFVEKPPINVAERIKLVKAMEYIARQINDEDIFISLWLTDGIVDGDISYGDLNVPTDFKEDEAYWYTDDETFSELMGTFLTAMKYAAKSGGLYCDGIEDSIDNK